MNKTGFAAAVVVLAAVLAFAPTASANAVLSLTDGTNTVSVTDNGAGDDSGGLGVVTYNGAVGNFSINVTTGTTKPVYTEPYAMDLNSVDVLSAGTGKLTIRFTDYDFAIAPNDFIRMSGGGTNQTSKVTYNVYVDGSSTPYDTLGTFAPGLYFGGSVNGPRFLEAGRHTFTQELVFDFARKGGVSGDFELNVVPEPASIAMLGGVLLLTCGAIRRKLRRP